MKTKIFSTTTILLSLLLCSCGKREQESQSTAVLKPTTPPCANIWLEQVCIATDEKPCVSKAMYNCGEILVKKEGTGEFQLAFIREKFKYTTEVEYGKRMNGKSFFRNSLFDPWEQRPGLDRDLYEEYGAIIERLGRELPAFQGAVGARKIQ